MVSEATMGGKAEEALKEDDPCSFKGRSSPVCCSGYSADDGLLISPYYFPGVTRVTYTNKKRGASRGHERSHEYFLESTSVDSLMRNVRVRKKWWEPNFCS